MPYTREQLMQGLRDADKAGDTAAAQAFAKQIQALGASSATQAAPTPAGASNPPPPSSAGPSGPEILQPRGLSQVGQDAVNALRLFNRGLTGGMWDPAVGAIKQATGTGSIAEERAKTEAASQQSGALGVVPGAIGSMYGPGKLMRAEQAASSIASPILRNLARPFMYGAEGATASGVQALGEGKDVPTAMAEGGGFSALLGSILGPLARTTVKAPAPTTAQFKAEAEAANKDLLNIQYGNKDALAAARAANIDASRSQLDPRIQAPEVRAQNRFTEFANDPAEQHSVAQFQRYQNAPGPPGIATRIEDLFGGATPVRGATNPDEVARAIQAARFANKNYAISNALDQPVATTTAGVPGTRPLNYNEAKDLTGSQGTYYGDIMQNTSDHAWRVAHGLGEPIAAGLAFSGEIGPALGTVGLSTIAAPALKKFAQSQANAQVPTLGASWRSATQGSPQTMVDPNWQRVLQSLVLGAQ